MGDGMWGMGYGMWGMGLGKFEKEIIYTLLINIREIVMGKPFFIFHTPIDIFVNLRKH